MNAPSASPVAVSRAPTPLDRRALRRRALGNVLRAGHCAPTVMKTLVEATGSADAPWLVPLASGLPGGIGNTGNECGAATASLVVLGLRHARAMDEDGVPAVVSKGRALLQDFERCHGSSACRDLLVAGRLPLRCIGVVRRAPERCVEIDGRDCRDALGPEARRACAELHAHLAGQGFHCAGAVLRAVRGEGVEPVLLDACSAFVGGTACAGRTCSALVAGVMLLGLAYGKPALTPGVVLRGFARMVVGGRALGRDLGAMNGPMNRGHALARWFRHEHGTTSCRELTGCDFSTEAGVRRYAESGGVERCANIARAVGERVREAVEGD